MIRDASIICFAHDWKADPTSKTHIMRILSEKNRILWINSIGWRRPTVSGHDARRIVKKLRQVVTESLVQINPNLHVASPFAVPLPGVPGVARLNEALLTTSIRYFAKRAGLEKPILWTFMPNTLGLVGRLGESRVIYHAVDEYAAFAGVPREAFLRMESEYVRRADLVIASSDSLCQERRRLNPCTYFVSHGVDVAHFSRTLDPGTTPPEDARGLTGPVIGFFGLIAEWVDLDLIRALAQRRPDWNFVMIGKPTAEVDLTPVRGLSNVRLLGQKPYETLPAYCRAFDVGIIPFKIEELTIKANPLKLREYLAAGLPVVSSDLPEVRKYASLVHLASGTDGFIGAIEQALADRSEVAARARVEAMKHESWEARVDEISELIESMEARV
jgi:glycosyltransferase involved in cell wall biosynthesis